MAVTQNELQGGTTTATNRAPAAKVIAGALANQRVAQALIAALGSSSTFAIVATSTSATTNFASLQVGDYLIHVPATAGNVSFETVTVAGTKPSAAVVGDLYVGLRVVNLDANNPIVPAGGQLTARLTGNGGTEF